MARARNIKPGFYKNEELAECSVWARFLFPGLWMMADREGRLEDRPKRIKAELLPYDTQDVEPLLRELATRGFLIRYEMDGDRYIAIPKFKEHQSPHYSEKESVIKPPSLPEKPPDIEPKNSEKKPSIKKGSQHSDSLNHESGFSDSPNPDSPNPEPKNVATGLAPRSPPRAIAAGKGEAPTGETWTAYATAYRDRYGVEPVRNAMVNGQLAELIKRLGREEAPRVAAFYVSVNREHYVRRKHAVGLLVQDYDSLRTEWRTGKAGTNTEARQVDRTQTNFNAFAPLLAEAQGGGRG